MNCLKVELITFALTPVSVFVEPPIPTFSLEGQKLDNPFHVRFHLFPPAFVIQILLTLLFLRQRTQANLLFKQKDEQLHPVVLF